jgi:hypothetical protein
MYYTLGTLLQWPYLYVKGKSFIEPVQSGSLWMSMRDYKSAVAGSLAIDKSYYIIDWPGR